MSITDDTMAIANELRRLIGSKLDDEQRALVAAWARAWDQVADQWARATDEIALTVSTGQRPTQGQILSLNRANQAMATTIGQIDGVATQMGVRLTTVTDDVVTATARAEARMIASQYPPGQVDWVRFDRVNPQALDAIVSRTTTQVTSRGRELSPHAYRTMLDELTRSIPEGLSPRESAARMLAGAERGFNGGLPRALTIARTEILDAYREAAYQQHQANLDVLAGWVWTAELDPDTCPACVAMHGSEHPNSEHGPDGHQNCRCARTPKTRSWEDLGFDVDEPDDLIVPGDEWFAAQPEATQLSIMGPARLDALRSGAVSFTDLATVRHTQGWRDSIVPTPVAQLI